jgi:hypothetical protein
MESLGAKRSIRSSLSGAGFLTPSLPLSRGYAPALRAVCLGSARRGFGDRPLLPQNRCLPPQKAQKGPRQREIAKSRQGNC